MLKFITGNNNKFQQVQKSLDPVKIEQLAIHLEEIQEIDPKKIIKHKILEAFKHHGGEFIVDDVSLYFECLDYKLPGPLIRWFNETLGNEGIALMCQKMGKMGARLVVIIGYAKNENEIIYFEEELEGRISAPIGSGGFGFDPIFIPNGANKTRAEMNELEYLKFSPRDKAVQKLKQHLEKNN
jgi:XTP/dITP diphosphohydrolase